MRNALSNLAGRHKFLRAKCVTTKQSDRSSKVQKHVAFLASNMLPWLNFISVMSFL